MNTKKRYRNMKKWQIIKLIAEDPWLNPERAAEYIEALATGKITVKELTQVKEIRRILGCGNHSAV
jgi:TusA-related sulfurtransferase